MAMIIGLRRRMSQRLRPERVVHAQRSPTSIIGTANDELDANNIQDATDPYGRRERRPDDAHRRAPSRRRSAPSCRRRGASRSSPFFIYRSALPTQTFEGIDLNNDGNMNDITAHGVHGTPGSTMTARATFEENGRVRNGQLQPRARRSRS